jgi:hypothetical protein
VTSPVPSHGIKGQVFVLVNPVCELLV